MFAGCPLVWVSKLQTLVTLSTAEAEYVSLSTAMRQLISTREILKEIQEHVFEKKGNYPVCKTHTRAHEDVAPLEKSKTAPPDQSLPTSILHEDNEACLKFATTFRMTPRTRHIGVHYHFFRSRVENLEIKIVPISSANQISDQFTKSLPSSVFRPLRDILMGWDPSP